MSEHFYGITDKGKRRERNEDTFFAREILNKRFIAAGVIDGVGGYKGGNIAAGIARSVIMKKLETVSEDVIEALREAVITANTKINKAKKTNGKNERMACVLTCIVADIKNNKCWYAHVGDTRVYLLRDQSLVKISKDHSAVGFLEESGRLSEEEAMRHPRRNEINKALGFEEDISTPEDFIETGESPFLPGDLLLLCSDGLTDMIGSGAITQVLTDKKSLASKAKTLVDAANEAGGNDNITAVLIENNNWPKQRPEPVPVERKKGEAVSVAIKEPDLQPGVLPAKQHRQSPIAFVILLLMGLAAVIITGAFQRNNKLIANRSSNIEAGSKSNEPLIQLMSTNNDLSKGYVFPAKNSIPELTAPLIISKDSFYINGNGARITAGIGYRGPAMIINSTAKHIVLDSLVFENFEVGIVVQKNNVTFRNVRFVNCRTPVQYMVAVPDSIITGRLKDSIFINQSKQIRNAGF
jgi:PPM family protein phosphatase